MTVYVVTEEFFDKDEPYISVMKVFYEEEDAIQYCNHDGHKREYFPTLCE